MSRKIRKGIAEETLEVLEKGFYKAPSGHMIHIKNEQIFALENTKLYRPEDSDVLLAGYSPKNQSFQTHIEVTNETTLDAVRRLIRSGEEQVFCLNFASAKNPGGGFLGGSQAQEESIARSTGLYPCQMESWEYYEVNRKTKTCLYTDYMIYSPKVPIIREEEGQFMEELMTVSILTAPAVNAGIVRTREGKKAQQIEEVMRRRINKVLAIALAHQHETVVLGAWGCGVFQNNPDEIAQYFADSINDEFKNQFRRITFAIYAKNPRFITPFQQVFN